MRAKLAARSALGAVRLPPGRVEVIQPLPHARALLLLVALAVAPALASAEPLDPRAFAFTAEVPALPAGELLALELPLELHAHARADLLDVRLADARGEELPSRPWVAGPQVRSVALASTRVEPAARGTAALVLDVGPREGLPPAQREHNRIELETGPGPFACRAEVAVSDDLAAWTVVERAAAVFRATSPERRADRSVRYPRVDRRYARVALSGPRCAVQPVAGQVFRDEVVRGEELPLPLELVRRAETDGGPTLLFDVGLTGLPLARIELAVHGTFPPALAVVRTGDEPDALAFATAGVLFHEDGARRLRVATEDARGRFVELALEAPADVSGANAFHVPRKLVVRGHGGPASLLVGSPAPRPRAEPDASLDPAAARPGPPVGALAANPSFDPEAHLPLAARFPWLAPVAVLLGMGAAGLVALRLARRRRAGRT